MQQIEKAKIVNSLLYPSLFVLLIWAIKLLELWLNARFSSWGIMPQTLHGLKGIIFAPLLHGDLAHLSANSIPMLVLGAILFYVYRSIAWRVFILIYVVTGLWVWVFGREAYHIGASGVVYGLASFLFFSGIFRKDSRLLALTFLVAFLYGSMIWGLFPELFPEKNISWESHLMGLLAGVVLAYFYKGDGPVRRRYSWELEDEDDIDEDDPDAYWNAKPAAKRKPVAKSQPESPTQINYIYKSSDEKENNENNGSQKINF
jgi:membrane associated rhomboid family serine protease